MRILLAPGCFLPLTLSTGRQPKNRLRNVTVGLRSIAVLALVALGACGKTVEQTAVIAAAPPSEALSLNDGVERLTMALFKNAEIELAQLSDRTLVIDPLIDRATGNQAISTRSMERRITEIVRERFKGIRPQPFTTTTLADRPLILVGSITPVSGPGVIPTTNSPTQTYRIWAAIADLRTNKIISHETAWVRADGVDMTPTKFFADSPAWLTDRSQTSYVRTCSLNPGDAIDPVYLSGIFTAAIVADGIKAYEAGRYSEALSLYTRAQVQTNGDQPRVYNGIYLANAALGLDAAAEEAFGNLVNNGLLRGKLAVKFVFRPSSTQFWPDRQISGPYPMWLRQIAANATRQSTCLRLVGHTSPTGAVAINQQLSLARAAFVKGELVQQAQPLSNTTETEGRGSLEPLVGSGRDDATDVLDRRVEFETRPCLRAALDAPLRG